MKRPRLLNTELLPPDPSSFHISSLVGYVESFLTTSKLSMYTSLSGDPKTDWNLRQKFSKTSEVITLASQSIFQTLGLTPFVYLKAITTLDGLYSKKHFWVHSKSERTKSTNYPSSSLSQIIPTPRSVVSKFHHNHHGNSGRIHYFPSLLHQLHPPGGTPW